MKTFPEVLKDMIKEQINETKGIDIFQITGVNSNQTYSVKRMNINESFNNVESLGVGLGNGKGQIKLYNENDLVLCTFIQNSQTPYILGSVYDIFSPTQDTRMSIKQNEYFVNNKANGSFIFIDENDNIKIRTPNGAKLKLNADGSFKLFSQNNLGVEIDSSGNLTLRGTNIYHTQSSGEWE